MKKQLNTINDLLRVQHRPALCVISCIFAQFCVLFNLVYHQPAQGLQAKNSNLLKPSIMQLSLF